MKKIIAVLTKEKKYAVRFCDYANRSGALSAQTIPFESPEELRKFASLHPIALLVADIGFSRSYCGGQALSAEDTEAGQRIFLEEGSDCGRDLRYDGEVVTMSKYQSAESLISGILLSAKGLAAGREIRKLDGSATVIGVYSPVMMSAKTYFSVALAAELSGKERTLYLCLEEFSAISRLLGCTEEEGMSEVVYLMKQGKLTGEKIRAHIVKASGIEFMPPVSDPEDQEEISSEDYLSLIKAIADGTDYRYIILDMQRFSGQTDVLADICEILYVPSPDDRISGVKTEEFLKYLARTRKDEWCGRIRRIRLPEPGSLREGTYAESLLFGAMGDFVREELRREGIGSETGRKFSYAD